jgi:outer membrane cobalamin receptor
MLRAASGHLRSTTTDAAGRFAFTNVPAGSYDVLAELEGFRATLVTVNTVEGLASDIRIHLTLSGVTETVVVSAGYVGVPRSEVPGSVTTITADAVAARQITTVAQALRMVPGYAVAATGGAGSLTSVFPRGGESDYTLVLLDGIRLNSMGGGFDFGHLTTAGLSSIEVVRGPQSAVFGADAIGGVIQLRTRVGGSPSLSAEFETGGYGSTRATIATSGALGRFSWGAHAERSSSDGWTGLAPGTSEHVTNDDDRASAVGIATNWTLADRTTLRIDGRISSDDRGYPGPFGSNPIGAYSGVDRVSRGHNNDASGSMVLTHAWGSQTAFTIRTTYADLHGLFASAWGDSSSRTRRLAAHAQLSVAVSSRVALTAGTDVMAERGDSTYVMSASDALVPVRRYQSGYFAEARFKPASRLSVTSGVRAQHVVRRAIAPDPNAYSPRPLLPEHRQWSINPRMAASYDLRSSSKTGGNWTRLHATAGTGFRPPDVLEIAFTDNPGLKPERSQSWDAGVEHSLLGGRWVADATAFANRYDDLIIAVGRSLGDYSRYQTDNLSNARARGLEASLALHTHSGLTMRASYTWLDTAVLAVDRSSLQAPAPFVVGDPLLRRPTHQGSVDITYARGPLVAFAHVGARSRALDVEPSWGAIYGGLFFAPGFAVADAGVSIAAGRGVSIVARIDNLLNRPYEAVLGYPAPRRTLTIGVRCAARR